MDEPKAEGQTQPQGVEQDLGRFHKLYEIAAWVDALEMPETGPTAKLKGPPLIPEEEVSLITRKIGRLMPTLSSPGSATLIDQMQFWEENKDMFAAMPAMQKQPAKTEEHQSAYNSITSHIDCKLPTFVAAAALQAHGWTVGVIFRNKVHPRLLVGKVGSDNKESRFLINYVPASKTYSTSVDVDVFEGNERAVEWAHNNVIAEKLVGEDEPWPIPLSEQIIERFDTWYTNSAAPTEDAQ